MTNKITNHQILLTGSTGLLGVSILEFILKTTNYKVVLLIRASDEKEAEKRWENLSLQIFGEKHEIANIAHRITVVCGDQIKVNLGLTQDKCSMLCDSINEIYHCAAFTNFLEPLTKVREVNVLGTQNIFDFANKCRHLQKMNYISTAFLAGNHKGEFREDHLDIGQNFNNPYEQSKFESELLIKQYMGRQYIINIFRPSIIVDEYCKRISSNMGLLHQLFRLLTLELFDEIPLDTQTFFNLIPSDVAAKAIFTLSTNHVRGDVYHVVSPTNFSLARLIKIACEFMDCKVPEYVSNEDFDVSKLSSAQKKILAPFCPYFNFRALFVSERTKAKLKKFNFTYPVIDDHFLIRLLEYANNRGCLRR